MEAELLACSKFFHAKITSFGVHLMLKQMVVKVETIDCQLSLKTSHIYLFQGTGGLVVTSFARKCPENVSLMISKWINESWENWRMVHEKLGFVYHNALGMP